MPEVKSEWNVNGTVEAIAGVRTLMSLPFKSV